MTQRTRAALNTLAVGNLADNTTGQVSAADVRDLIRDLADSGVYFGTPQQHGALANGVADDTVAIQAALDNGGIVFFPAGNYLISDGLRAPSGTRIVGEGYNSKIFCGSAGWLLDATTRYGLITIYQKHCVSVCNVRLVGTIAADQTHTPKLIYLEDAEDATISDCWLENTAFEGVWQGGTASLTKRLIIRNNRLTTVGYPAGAYVGLPAIQVNASEVLIEGNILTNVGTGIGASGERITVANNRITGVTICGIGTGDGARQHGISIVGNVIEIAGTPARAIPGIVLDDSVSPSSDIIVVKDNLIRMSAVAGDQSPIGIRGATAELYGITGNTIEIEGFGVGIYAQGIAAGATAIIKNNTVRVFSESAVAEGIAGTPNGGGTTLTVFSANNRVMGLTRANGSFAYDFNANGGGTLNLVADNDRAVEGLVRLSSALYYPNGEYDSLPINFPLPDLYASATYNPPSLNTGVLDTIQTIAVTGAALGMKVEASFSLDLQGIALRAWVSAADTVSYQFHNVTAGTIDLASGTVRVTVYTRLT